jgi:hypothetical protein
LEKRLNEAQRQSGLNGGNVRFEVFTAVTMKNGVFWVVEGGARFLRNVGSYKSHTA